MEPTREPTTGSSEKDRLLDRMQSLASALVRFAWEKFRLRLDYSDLGITQVEEILDRLQIDFARKGTDSKAKIQGLSSYFGAFIGEVIRRKHGGVWTAEIPDENSPAYGVEVAGLIFAPARNAYLRLMEGSAFSVKVLYQKFEEAVSERRAVPDEPAIDVKRVRGLVRNYAVQAVQDARKKFDFELDYTEASLDLLETILSRIADLVGSRAPATQRLTEEEKMLLKAEGALNYGAYLGEIICKNLGGDWQDTIPGNESRRIVVVIDGKWFDPLECVRVAIKSPQDVSVKKFYLETKKTALFHGVITSRKR